MSTSTRKLNFLIEEDISRDLEDLVPVGQRSKVVNKALRKELELIRRKKALAELRATLSSRDRLSTADIVEGLAKERSAH
jgi:hypothetical protein